MKNFFEILKKDKQINASLSFSLQSLNNMILKRMKRRHSVEQVIELFKKIKTISPNASFGADIITGFPTETEKMFLDTKKTIKSLKFLISMFFLIQKKMGQPLQECLKYLLK